VVHAHRPGCARSIRSGGLAAGRTEDEIAHAIAQHCAVTLLRAHRLARGWTLQLVAAEIGVLCLRSGADARPGLLSHQRVSKWEIGEDLPSPPYLDALCRLYGTRADLLGFGRDYSAAGSPGLLVAGATVGEVPVQLAHVADGAVTFTAPGPRMIPLPVTDALRSAREQADALLETQSVSAVTVEQWEYVAEEYGRLSVLSRQEEFLVSVTADVTELVAILNRRQPLEYQQRLCRVLARLAGLVAFNAAGAGAMREASRWFHTARLAGDEVADRQVRAWVMHVGSVVCFWRDGSMAGRAVDMCQTARSLAGASPSPVAVIAAASQARAHAWLGQRSAALDAIGQAEAAFGKLSPAEITPSHLYVWERVLRYHQECVLTWLGETAAAIQTQDYALSLAPHCPIEGALIQLDQAHCRVMDGELDQACTIVRQVVQGAPAGLSRGVVLRRAQQVVQLAAAQGDTGAQLGSLQYMLRSMERA